MLTRCPFHSGLTVDLHVDVFSMSAGLLGVTPPMGFPLPLSQLALTFSVKKREPVRAPTDREETLPSFRGLGWGHVTRDR